MSAYFVTAVCRSLLANANVSVKTFCRLRHVSKSCSQAPAAEDMLDSVVCGREQSVFRCALKVVMVAEIFATGDREFQTAGAMMLNALNWKLILVAS